MVDGVMFGCSALLSELAESLPSISCISDVGNLINSFRKLTNIGPLNFTEDEK